MQSRVFLPEQIRRHIDLSHAETFGELCPLLDHIDPFNTSSTIDNLTTSLTDQKFNPSHDYLCLAGRTLSVALALLAVVSKYKSVRALMFDARRSEYSVRVIGESNEQQEDEGTA